MISRVGQLPYWPLIVVEVALSLSTGSLYQSEHVLPFSSLAGTGWDVRTDEIWGSSLPLIILRSVYNLDLEKEMGRAYDRNSKPTIQSGETTWDMGSAGEHLGKVVSSDKFEGIVPH
jgi:hypothetical protein